MSSSQLSCMALEFLGHCLHPFLPQPSSLWQSVSRSISQFEALTTPRLPFHLAHCQEPEFLKDHIMVLWSRGASPMTCLPVYRTLTRRPIRVWRLARIHCTHPTMAELLYCWQLSKVLCAWLLFRNTCHWQHFKNEMGVIANPTSGN